MVRPMIEIHPLGPYFVMFLHHLMTISKTFFHGFSSFQQLHQITPMTERSTQMMLNPQLTREYKRSTISQQRTLFPYRQSLSDHSSGGKIHRLLMLFYTVLSTLPPVVPYPSHRFYDGCLAGHSMSGRYVNDGS